MSVREENYHERTDDEKKINKEVSVRRELAGIYNLSKLNFAATPEYYNYLEEMEDVVYDKTYGAKEDKGKVDSRITAFKKKHATEISENKARLSSMATVDVTMEDSESGAGESSTGKGYAMGGQGVVQVRAAAKVEWPAMPQAHADTKRLKQSKLSGEELHVFKTREAEAGGYNYEWGKQRNASHCTRGGSLLARGLQL